MQYSLSFFGRVSPPGDFWTNLNADTALAAAQRAHAAGCVPNWVHGGTVYGCCTQYSGPSMGEVIANLTRHDAAVAAASAAT